jgi:hypothetical protein
VPTDLPQVTDKLYHITGMLYRVHLDIAGFELTTLVVTCIDCISSYKFNYHTINLMIHIIDFDSKLTIVLLLCYTMALHTI